MTESAGRLSPSGVLASRDAGTPFALPGEQSVDALRDLEFEAVLAVVAAYAVGPLGAARVRARWPSGDVAWIREELATVAEARGVLGGDPGLAAEPVPDLTPALRRLRVAGSYLEATALVEILRVLVAARSVAAQLRRLEPVAPRVARLVAPPPEKELERRLERSVSPAGEILDTASPALASARSDLQSARTRLIQRLEAILRRIEPGEGSVTVRNGRYVIPVPRDLRGRPDGIIHDESASGATLFIEPAQTIELGNALRSAEAQAEREALQVLRDLTELLRPQVQPLQAAFEMCVAVDDLAARARYAAAVDGHLPAVVPAPAPLVLLNARHPLLLAALPEGPRIPPSQGSVVPFDLDLSGAERTILLSGPNTGGKTVLLKAVGLVAALAQSGILPPVGPGTALPVFHRFYADIGDRQSIAASLSTFSAHVGVLRRILAEADDATLVLLDEVGSGTDPAEGAALASAALGSLTRRGAITLATTHLGSLKQLAARSEGVVNASLQFDAATLTPTYRLLKGVPGRSYGLAIARRLGVPEDVLAEAEAQVPAAEKSLDALLAAVEARARDLAEGEAALTERSIEADSLSARLAVQADSQAEREAELNRRAREAERTARAQAKAFLLEARQRVEQAIGLARAAVDEVTAREARRLVEEGVRAEAEALEEGGRTDGRTEGQGTTPAPGSRVRLESGGVGELLEIRSDGKARVRVGSVAVLVPVDRVVAVGHDSRTSAPVHSRSAPSVGPSDRPSTPLEIDLRGLTGDEAEQALLPALDAAILAENPFLRIIHGKGTGVVRERVRAVLAGDRRVRRFEFAASNQGGTGVTIAEFA
jgi:DNA mismatch repair protein MutS2